MKYFFLFMLTVLALQGCIPRENGERWVSLNEQPSYSEHTFEGYIPGMDDLKAIYTLTLYRQDYGHGGLYSIHHLYTDNSEGERNSGSCGVWFYETDGSSRYIVLEPDKHRDSPIRLRVSDNLLTNDEGCRLSLRDDHSDVTGKGTGEWI